MNEHERQALVDLVRQALAEDIGSGDLTAALIDTDSQATARVISREAAILCGRPWFDETFRQLSDTIEIDWHHTDGDRIAPGDPLCTLTGPARPLLSGERTALNLLQTLSGTATLTDRYRQAIGSYPVRLLDTRKTVPGLRLAQKYAVRCGGGHNHRMGLYDAILIKENHIAACGSITAAVSRARQTVAEDTMIEVEVEDIAEFTEAMRSGADKVLLDNFSETLLRQAVDLRRAHGAPIRIEVSGGIGLETIGRIAATGVDEISVGALTKDVQAIDLSMRITRITQHPNR